jgi:hypothetical protein
MPSLVMRMRWTSVANVFEFLELASNAYGVRRYSAEFPLY